MIKKTRKNNKIKKNRKGGASRCETMNDWYHLCYDDLTDQNYVYFFNNRDERWYYNDSVEEFINDKDNSVCYIYNESAVIYNSTGLDEPELIFKFAYNKKNGNEKLYFNKNGFIIKDGKIKLMKNYKLHDYNDNWTEYYDTEAHAYYWYNESDGTATFLNPYEDLDESPKHNITRKSKPKNFFNSTIRRKTKESNTSTNSKQLSSKTSSRSLSRSSSLSSSSTSSI